MRLYKVCDGTVKEIKREDRKDDEMKGKRGRGQKTRGK